MLNILRGASRSATRALNNPISLQRAFLSDEIKAEETTKTLSGFAKAFEKFEKPENFSEPQPEENATFLSLLRNSKFVDVSQAQHTYKQIVTHPVLNLYNFLVG